MIATNSSPTLLTTRELATRLRVSAGTIRLWVQRGILPAVRFSQRPILFDFEQIMANLENQTLSDKEKLNDAAN